MSADPFDLTGRTAIVTGASSGLGVVFAEALASHGASVVLGARRVDRLEEVARRLGESGTDVLVAECDVTDPAQVEAMVAAAVHRFGGVDVLVNNAGSAADGGPMAERLPHALFEQVVRVNLMGTWYCSREAGAVMLRQGGGSIINVSSAAGLAGVFHFPPAYQATKAAVINLARNLALSWADRGVRVNTLAPGWFPSEMASPYIDAPIYGDRVLEGIPLGRVGELRELVAPLLLLASDAGSYMTGQVLVVDGGLTASSGARPYGEELYGFHAQVVPDGLGERVMPEGAAAPAAG